MSRILWVSVFLLAITFSTPVAWGQNQPRSVSVSGSAEKELTPDHYQISVILKANGKTMAITNDDYRKKLENVRTVFNEMDFPEVKIFSKGKFLTDSPFVDQDEMQIMMMDGRDPDQQDKSFYIVERLILDWQPSAQASSLDLENGIQGLLDRINAAKLSFSGEANPNYYQVSNLVVGLNSGVKQEEKSLRVAAFADAKSQAEELAQLAGAKIGRVIEIEVASANQDIFSSTEEVELKCRLGQKIKLKSVLNVRFELE